MKKILSIACLALFLAGVVGCGSSSTTGSTTPANSGAPKSTPAKSP